MSNESDAPIGLFGTTRAALIRSLVLLVLMTSALMLGGTLIAVSRLFEETTRVIVSRAGVETATALDQFFEGVETELRVAEELLRRGELSREPERFNALMIPLIEARPAVTSILFANEAGDEILLLRDGTTWRNRLSSPARYPGQVRWMRWSDDGEVLEDEIVPLDYDSRTRPWYEEAQQRDYGDHAWTAPYTFHTTRDPGITVSTRVAGASGYDILAFDVMLLDVSEFTTSHAPAQEALTLVLTDDHRVLGLPADDRFEDRGRRRDYVLEPLESLDLPLASVALATIGESSEPTQVRYDGRRWWAARVPYDLSTGAPLEILVIVPETTLLQDAAGGRNAIVAANLFVLAIAILVALGLERAFRSRLERAVRRAKRVGHYQLVSRLGSGGMGDVYRAEHDMLRRPTAVKLLRSDRLNGEAVRRFEREVRYTSQLTHPNTVTIYDFGRTREGVFYYAMELLEGLSLQEILDRHGAIPAARAVYLIEQVCRSLAEAHDAGLVHRDIKPGNLFVCRIGGEWDVAKVLDFGLVKHVDAANLDETALSHGVVGTPAYIAPEAIEGVEEVGPAADIYALGATLWHLLVGRPVFAEESMMSVLMKHISERPRSPRSLAEGDVSMQLEAIVIDCLAKAPDDRPSGVRELAERLRATPEWGAWSATHAAAWWSAHPLPATQEDESEGSLDVALDDD